MAIKPYVGNENIDMDYAHNSSLLVSVTTVLIRGLVEIMTHSLRH